MAAPTYSAGTPGNVFNNVPLVAGGKNVAALVDLSTVLGGALHCQMTTGATAPTAATAFCCFRVFAATAAVPNATLSGAVSGGATSIPVNSTAGVSAGQQVAILAAATGFGEVVTVQSASAGALTLQAGTQGAYQAGDKVFLIEQSASGGSVQPGSSWSANTTYGTSIYPPAAWLWVVQAANADAAQPVTVSVTLDKNPSFQ